MSSKTFRCYVKYQSETTYRKDGKFYKRVRTRKGPYVFVTAMDRDSAIAFMELAHVKPKKNETVEGIIATAWKEDRALRAMGAKELPFKY